VLNKDWKQAAERERQIQIFSLWNEELIQWTCISDKSLHHSKLLFYQDGVNAKHIKTDQRIFLGTVSETRACDKFTDLLACGSQSLTCRSDPRTTQILQLLHTQRNGGHHIGEPKPDHLDHLSECELIVPVPNLREVPDVGEGVHVPISHLCSRKETKS
jgi:hypothetical protein